MLASNQSLHQGDFWFTLDHCEAFGTYFITVQSVSCKILQRIFEFKVLRDLENFFNADTTDKMTAHIHCES